MARPPVPARTNGTDAGRVAVDGTGHDGGRRPLREDTVGAPSAGDSPLASLLSGHRAAVPDARVRVQLASDAYRVRRATEAEVRAWSAALLEALAKAVADGNHTDVGQQQSLLELSTPVVKLWDGIVALR